MTDPILYLSMILGLAGMYVLISSFSDDDDDSNDDGERDLFNLEYVKVWKKLLGQYYFESILIFFYMFHPPWEYMLKLTAVNKKAALKLLLIGGGEKIWTSDLRVMSPTSYQTALPRVIYLAYMWKGNIFYFFRILGILIDL